MPRVLLGLCLLLALATVACGPPPCGSDNCGGCCDKEGRCQAGLGSQACGSQGRACQACAAGLSCSLGLCTPSSGGGAGGGSGGGGGGTGGGGAGGGGGGGGGGTDAGTCTCTLPFAVGQCVGDGGCTVKSCLSGHRDLDGDPQNGCEASCSPLGVSASGSLDYNLDAVTLSGRVTLEQATAPVGSPRGTLRFLLAESQKPVDVELPPTGEATYTTTLLTGTYRISFLKSGDCRPQALPCGERVLQVSQALTASGSLNFDLSRGGTDGGTSDGGVDLITVSGEVKVNGASLPNATSSRGRVVFRGPQGAAASATLSSSGPATYSVQVPRGTYDVQLEGASACGPSTGPLPCYASVQKKAVPLLASGALDVDVRVVQVTGALKLSGQPLPAHPSGQTRALLRWSDESQQGPAGLDLGSTGAATYSVLLYPGTFEVAVQPGASCTAGPLPCQRRVVRGGLSISASGAIDFDVQAVTVTGQVKANGQALGPSATGQSRGRLSFKDDDGASSTDLAASGPATYQLLLYSGNYAAVLRNDADCPDGPLPCGEQVAKAAVALFASGAFDVDVQVARVSGAVTVNGAAMVGSPSSAPRGTLSFAPVSGQGPSTADALSSSGPANFAVALYPGDYRVRFSNRADCPVGPTPCQDVVVRESLQVAGSSSTGFDLKVLDLSGAVTANGQPIAPSQSGGPRGKLGFREQGRSVEVNLPAAGAATYSVRLYPGTYDVVFDNATDCAPGTLPCQGGVVTAQQSLSASGALNVDLKVATLSGVVTLNGQPPPASARARGELRFGMWNGTRPATAALGSSGPATYTVKLLLGDYDVGFANDVDCPQGAFPCQRKVLRGCQLPR